MPFLKGEILTDSEASGCISLQMFAVARTANARQISLK